MIEQDNQYNFKDDLLIIKNFNLESTKIISDSVLMDKQIPENNQEVFTKEIKEIKEKKENKENFFVNTHSRKEIDLDLTENTLIRRNSFSI